MDDHTQPATVQQRSPQWHAARLGHATGSRFRDVLSKLKNGAPAQARLDYLRELAVERLTGRPAAAFTTAAMQWGIDCEPAGRAAYAARTGATVEEVGFIRHPTLAAGCSPDGVVLLDGAIEIKCPTSSIHLATLCDGMPAVHAPQVQGCMWLTGAAWLDFVSYDPRFPPGLDLYVERVQRDDQFIERLELEVAAFLSEVDDLTQTLKQRHAT
jgi:hypothetical protein